MNNLLKKITVITIFIGLFFTILGSSIFLNIKLLKEYMNILTPRERDVLTKRYGLDNNDEITQKEIAKNLGISRSYVSRIEKRAIVTEQYVLAQDVIITKDNPMGVWCYGNIEVVELAKYCLENEFEKSLNYFDDFCKGREISMELYNSMKRWFISQEILI